MRDKDKSREQSSGELTLLRQRIGHEPAQEALKESQQQLVNIINFLPDATFMIDQDGKVIFWNKAMEEMTGIEAADMLGRGNYAYALPFYGERRPMLIDLVLKRCDEIEAKYVTTKREDSVIAGEAYIPMLRGREAYLAGKAGILHDSKGEVLGAIECIRDMTEQRSIERSLSSEHEKLSSILDGSPISSFVIDRERRVTAWNMVNEIISGIPKQEVLGQPLDLSRLFKEKVPPSLAVLVLEMTDEEIIRRCAHKGIWKSKIHPEAFECTGSIWIKGEERTMAIQATRIRDSVGRVIGAIQCAEDITEQKRAERALRESEELYRTALESSNDGVAIVQDGRYVYLNQRILDTLGRERDELLGRAVTSYIHPDDREIVLDYYERYRKGLPGPNHFEVRAAKPDGTIIYAEVSPVEVVYKGRKSLLAYCRNITDRKYAEEVLRETNETLHAIIAASPVGILALDREARVIKWSPAAERIFGGKEQEVIGKFNPIVPENKRDEFLADFSRVIGGEEYSRARERRRQKKDGSLIDISISTAPLLDATGDIRGAVGIIDDITERKQMEEALRRSEEKYRHIVENSVEGIARSTPDGKFLAANPALARIFGFASVEQMLQEVQDIASQLYCDPGDRLRLLELLRKQPHVFGYEAEMRRRDGETFWMSINMSSICDDNGAVLSYDSFLSDITERKRAEKERLQMAAQLHQVQKAESLGRMAGAIAHQFNTLLGVVIGRLELAFRELDLLSGPRNHLTEAMKASQRAAEISRLMLTYLGQTIEKIEPCNVVDMVRETVRLLASTLPRRVRVRMDLPPEEIMIQGDKVHIEQALTNLMLNAGEAIENGGGEIAVTVDVMSGDKLHGLRLFPSDWKPEENSYVVVSVSDTGSGLDPALVERIFDPFFSTKFAGRGLGLAVVLGIVRAHGGALAVESQPGRGSLFHTFLPLLGRQRMPAGREPTVDAQRSEHSELVLVVEDEPTLRDMLEAMLKGFGYGVLAAGDGREALSKFREHQDEVRLVLLDHGMPGMNGWEILTALRAVRADLPVILSSGYDEAHVMRGNHSQYPQVFLRKPYHMKDLEAALGTTKRASPIGKK